MSGLTLYTNAMSRGNTVDLFLKILDVPYQRVELDYGADMHTPEYLAINPMGKVPALTDGDRVITETAAILPINSLKKALHQRLMLRNAAPITAGSCSPPVRLKPLSPPKRWARC